MEITLRLVGISKLMGSEHIMQGSMVGMTCPFIIVSQVAIEALL